MGCWGEILNDKGKDFKSFQELEDYKLELQRKKKTLIDVREERRRLYREELVYKQKSPYMQKLRDEIHKEERIIEEILKDIDNGD
jgi:hypothetical protein